MPQIQRKNSVFLTDLEDFPVFRKDNFSLKIDVRYLSEETQRKAERELNETPDVKKRALKELSQLIQNDKTLIIPHENTNFLLKFLRARKFDVSEALNLVKNYFKFKNEFPQLFQNVIPSECASIFAMNAVILSPLKTQHGHRVIMAQAEAWNPDVLPMELIAAMFVIGEGLLMEPESQVNGFVTVIDFKGFSYKHFKHITLSLMKLIIRLISNVLPVSVKGIHYVNQNMYINILYRIVKPFLPKEINDILHFHGNDLESLYEFVPKECLLECFGGTIRHPKISEVEYREFLKKFDEEYIAYNSLGYRKL